MTIDLDFLAVIGGIITPTLLISGTGSNALNLDEQTRQYMISASLIVSGLMRYVLLSIFICNLSYLIGYCSIVQIIRLRIPKTRYFIGAGYI